MRFIPAALLAFSLMTSAALAQEMKPVRSITVSGEAKKHVAPDEAHLYVNVNAHNVKLAAAKSEHDRKLKDLLALADKAGIEEKYLKTENSNVQPEYDYNNGKATFRDYMIASRLDITVKKPQMVGELLEQLADKQFDDTSVNYTIAEPDKLRDALLDEAIRNARAKAERMADAAGAHIGRVFAISEGIVQFQQPVPMMAMAGVAMAGSRSVAAVSPPVGEQEVNATVTVSYELKD